MIGSNHNRGIFRSRKDPKSKIGRSWVFGIGIDHYIHYSGLNNAVRDVEDFCKLLSEEYSIDELFNLFNEKATRRNILDKLDYLSDNVKEEDNLIIYFSGHGELGKKTKGFWIPHDALKDSVSQHIENTTIISKIENIDARHIVLISDSCFSGSLIRKGKSRQVSSQRNNYLEARKSRIVICSGDYNQPVYDGKPGSNSPFATTLMNILRENRRYEVRTSYIVEKLYEFLPTNIGQSMITGRLVQVGDEWGEYIFRRRQVSQEELLWDKVSNDFNIENLKKYKLSFPEGKYINQANFYIRRIEEESDWESTCKRNSLEAYYQFLDKYKFSIHSQNAIEEIASIKKINSELNISENEISLLNDKYKVINFSDDRDNRLYRFLEVKELYWSIDNLCYSESPHHQNELDKFKDSDGIEACYYSWEVAKAICPSGCRLPTNKEWRNLIEYLTEDLNNETLQFFAYNGYIQGRKRYSHLKAGYYWTSQSMGPESAVCYIYNADIKKVYRDEVSKDLKLSCKFVMDRS